MYDYERVQAAIRELIAGLGEDPDRGGLSGTPARVARAYQEIFSGTGTDPKEHLRTLFDVGSDDLVLVKNIEFHSMCEHHLLPFFGHVTVAYLPSRGRITGLSKLARCVDGYARRPQIQERLTAQIADAVEEVLDPWGLAVVVEAEHMCMTIRGVRKSGSRTLTSTFRGALSESNRQREVLDLIRW